MSDFVFVFLVFFGCFIGLLGLRGISFEINGSVIGLVIVILRFGLTEISFYSNIFRLFGKISVFCLDGGVKMFL